jgi:hypothetical protein
MGSNNYAELMNLKLLISLTIEKDCHSFTVFGDSMNVINWIRGTQRCTNTRLANIVEDIKFLQTSFDSLTCRHQGCRPIGKCRVNGRKYVKEVSSLILTPIYLCSMLAGCVADLGL